MPDLQPVTSDVLARLADEMLGGLGCTEYGVVMQRGARSWGAHESGKVVLPTAAPGGTAHTLRIAYDERRAPYPLDATGAEDTALLLSLADEEDHVACAWARVPEGSPLRGVGIDLVSASAFGERPTAKRFIRLLFTEAEHEVAFALYPDDQARAYAVLFGAKEASFKTVAAPLRAWYRTHTERLAFEVRHFVATAPGLERGEGRDGAAQRALDTLGITRVVWREVLVDGYVVVLACALAEHGWFSTGGSPEGLTATSRAATSGGASGASTVRASRRRASCAADAPERGAVSPG